MSAKFSFHFFSFSVFLFALVFFLSPSVVVFCFARLCDHDRGGGGVSWVDSPLEVLQRESNTNSFDLEEGLKISSGAVVEERNVSGINRKFFPRNYIATNKLDSTVSGRIFRGLVVKIL